MKLSLDRRLGHTRITGGRLLRVIKDHGVSLMDTLPKYVGRKTDDAWAFAKLGDLAVEVLYKKTGNLLGYSYLTGDAIQARRDIPPAIGSYFEPVEGILIDLPSDKQYMEESPEVETQKRDFQEKVIMVLAETKFGPHRIAAFEYRPVAPVDLVARSIMSVWSGIEAEDGRLPHEIDVFGLIHGRNLQGQKCTLRLHFQPEGYTQDDAATPFQVALVVSSLENERKRRARAVG